MSSIKLYDTTLRDGQQREGASLLVEDKLRIAARLDALGIHYIEGGFLGSNPVDSSFFAQAAEQASAAPLRNAQLCAFGMTHRKGIAAHDDPYLQALAASKAQVVTLVGKASDMQVSEVLGVSADENLRMIASSINYLVRSGKQVFFDAEHFFDGYKSDPGYALATLLVAHEAGASAVILCDTNGGTLPHEIYAQTARTIETMQSGGYELTVGIHAHNDCGCAVANSLEAVRAGATQVQGTINGFGERVGNADLLAVLANLQLKMGHQVVSDDQLKLLTETAHFVAEIFNITADPHQPYFGKSAFAHKGGIHSAAALKYEKAYSHIDPAKIGNFSHVVISELAGKAALDSKAAQLGISVPRDDASLQALLDTVKEQEARGYSFEAADASLALLLCAKLGEPYTCFDLESFRVIAEKREDGKVMSEATIKLIVGNERHVATGEGNGPVNALDAALRLAIQRFYPQVAGFELTDYKVRVLDESIGTGAATRVLIETSDGDSSWGTVGVSNNVIEASWDALVEAITFGLLRAGRSQQTQAQQPQQPQGQPQQPQVRQPQQTQPQQPQGQPQQPQVQQPQGQPQPQQPQNIARPQPITIN